MKTIVVMLLVAVVLNIFLIVRLFDVSLSLDYARSEAALRASKFNKLEAIVRVSLNNISADDFSGVVRELVDQGFEVEEGDGTTEIEGVEVNRVSNKGL